MTPAVAEALRTVAARRPLSRPLAERDVRRSHGREGDRGAEGRAPARDRDARRDLGRDRGSGHGAPRPHAPRHDTPLAPPRHVRAGRARPRSLQRLHGGGDRRGGGRSRGRQARESLDLLARGLGGRARVERAPRGPRARGGGPRARRSRARLSLRAELPSRDARARDRPARARHPHDLQRARPAREPGRSDAAS